jgi:hypothetical protein
MHKKEYLKKINKLNAHYLPIYTYKYLFNFLGHPKRKYIMEPHNIQSSIEKGLPGVVLFVFATF